MSNPEPPLFTAEYVESLPDSDWMAIVPDRYEDVRGFVANLSVRGIVAEGRLPRDNLESLAYKLCIPGDVDLIELYALSFLGAKSETLSPRKMGDTALRTFLTKAVGAQAPRFSHGDSAVPANSASGTLRNAGVCDILLFVMPRKSTPTFIVELPLVISKRDEREMLVRLELARQLSNACLGEALRRLDLMRESLAWARAKAMPRLVGKKPNKERHAAFAAARHAYGFTSDSISAFGTQCKNEAKWNVERSRTDPRLGAHETQRIAERAYSAAEMHAFGVRGRPRFKGKARPLHSLEGKSAGSSVCWNAGTGCLEWGGLRLRAMFAPDGRDPWLEQGLKARTKFARIVWRNVAGERRWFVQLAQEGLAPLKYATVDGAVIGLDVGPSTIAVYSEQGAGLAPLAPEVLQPWAAARTIQRAMDRSRRATNPQCFNVNGAWKRGAKVTVRSAGYKRLGRELAETERVLEKRRARSHGALANRILACGNVLQSEKLSYTAFQRSFGRSTKVRAAGSLMALLRRKAERAGGELRDLDTWSLKLSQYDHTTNTCTKKTLSQRWHVLGDGSGVVQRDLYSAFLAAHVSVSAKDAIHQSRAVAAWPAAQSLLGRAGWMYVASKDGTQPVSVASLLATAPVGFGLPTPERVARQRASAIGDASDVVVGSETTPREPKRADGYGPRTPWL
jgi:putative transposase